MQNSRVLYSEWWYETHYQFVMWRLGGCSADPDLSYLGPCSYLFSSADNYPSVNETDLLQAGWIPNPVFYSSGASIDMNIQRGAIRLQASSAATATVAVLAVLVVSCAHIL